MMHKYRFGIGEWYGKSFVSLTRDSRQYYSKVQQGANFNAICPWRSSANEKFICNKKGGVCSLRLYQQDMETMKTSIVQGPEGLLRTTCPNRFYESNMVFEWIGKTILNDNKPMVLNEIQFLERVKTNSYSGSKRVDVGYIDHILVHTDTKHLNWCALEMQAVYFSGATMSKEFKMIQEWDKEELPFPCALRRPDYRSSGPKRLMPQLQIKVPTLRRWGKKMAVVVDQGFFEAMGNMNNVTDISNCDVAWFVVKLRDIGESIKMEPAIVRMSTLERAVEGLTAGKPVTLSIFEERIREKINY